MLTRIRIRNFKLFDDAVVDLGSSVVLVGPNNSGKTTVLQALALWELGLKKWLEKRSNGPTGAQRVGVAINRRDLLSIPVPYATLLWRDLHVRRGQKVEGRQVTQNILVEVTVDGVIDGRAWTCGLEFDYANEESMYCRPLRLAGGDDGSRMPVPEAASRTRVAFLPPMSGLAAEEPRLEPGRINVLLGEGQTAQVLRNLCHQVHARSEAHGEWNELRDTIQGMFGVKLDAPLYVPERGEIRMTYRERSGVELALSSSGRGLQQVVLLLAHIYANPGTVLLLDEPDAHLEVLRQREIYRRINRIAADKGCQIIAASHSEVVLEEAADRDVVVAFVGRPHRIDDRSRSQVVKALRDIGYDQYYAAEATGWVLYLEGSTDLEILHQLACILEHPAAKLLERPFFKSVETNLPQRAREHFYGLREAKPDLVGIAVFDRLDKELHRATPLTELMWSKREIENYICRDEVLARFARHEQPDDLFGRAEADRRETVMRESIARVRDALRTLGKPDAWSAECKVSDDFLPPLFQEYFRRLDLPNLMDKSDYHVLASLLDKDEVDREVVQKLDAIAEVAACARPRS